MIHAITWAFVPTSGAGMSRSGPIMMLTSVVAARHLFELALGEGAGIDNHAALGAAVGEIHERALPRHPHGQGAALVQGHTGVIADAAFGGALRHVVLDAKAGEDALVAVVHHHREVDNESRWHVRR